MINQRQMPVFFVRMFTYTFTLMHEFSKIFVEKNDFLKLLFAYLFFKIEKQAYKSVKIYNIKSF